MTNQRLKNVDQILNVFLFVFTLYLNIKLILYEKTYKLTLDFILLFGVSYLRVVWVFFKEYLYIKTKTVMKNCLEFLQAIVVSICICKLVNYFIIIILHKECKIKDNNRDLGFIYANTRYLDINMNDICNNFNFIHQESILLFHHYYLKWFLDVSICLFFILLINFQLKRTIEILALVLILISFYDFNGNVYINNSSFIIPKILHQIPFAGFFLLAIRIITFGLVFNQGKCGNFRKLVSCLFLAFLVTCSLTKQDYIFNYLINNLISKITIENTETNKDEDFHFKWKTENIDPLETNQKSYYDFANYSFCVHTANKYYSYDHELSAKTTINTEIIDNQDNSYQDLEIADDDNQIDFLFQNNELMNQLFTVEDCENTEKLNLFFYVLPDNTSLYFYYLLSAVLIAFNYVVKVILVSKCFKSKEKQIQVENQRKLLNDVEEAFSNGNSDSSELVSSEPEYIPKKCPENTKPKRSYIPGQDLEFIPKDVLSYTPSLTPIKEKLVNRQKNQIQKLTERQN